MERRRMIRFSASLSTVVYPGGRFRCSAPQTHHGFMRTTWIFLRPDKTEIARGEDFFELAGDGRIRRVTGFFGEAPAIKP